MGVKATYRIKKSFIHNFLSYKSKFGTRATFSISMFAIIHILKFKEKRDIKYTVYLRNCVAVSHIDISNVTITYMVE